MAASRTHARAWPFVRAATAALALVAIVAQLERTVRNAQESTTDWGSDVGTVVTNFLSFFTIQSNLAAAIVMAVAAVWAWTSGGRESVEPRWLATLLVCVTTYMIVTGVVYNLLLRGIALPQGVTVPWSNEVLHVVVPGLLLIDLLFAPKRRALPWSTAAIALGYPLVWVVYTMVRGPLVISPSTGNPWWYPYPFLDPNRPGGVTSVALYVVVIAIGIAATAAAVVGVGRLRARR